jgi:cysteinyl-tRNA synthetase
MPIRLHDTLSRTLRELRRPDPADPKDFFTFYNCGPTVYGPAHIGNFRTFVINDVLRRLLQLEFGAAKVKYVRNLTDVDDKTIKRAREEGRSLAEVTQQWTDKFHADCAALNCLPLPAACEPTATGYIRQQVDMIDVLLRKGHAYRAPDGSVYFKVSSFADYGKLSRVKERELKIGTALKPQAADADEKEDASDFALWKAWKPEDGPVKWDGDLKPRDAADGRPGWHIECSAMSKALLGDTIDLHTGGEDLEFPHHENEIAQSECCNGVPFARHWYHSKHLLVDGKKMSKSLGNLYTLDDLTAKGFSPMAVRYALLAGHPQKQLNFTLESLHAAEHALQKLRHFRSALLSSAKDEPAASSPSDYYDPVLDALRNDLNTPDALGTLFSLIHPAKKASLPAEVAALDRVLFAFGFDLEGSVLRISAPAEILALAEKRWAAKQARDWAAADALRKEIAAAGWSMLDGKDGFKLEPLKKP